MNKRLLTAYRVRWQGFNAHGQQLWQGLALREKRMVAATALGLGGLLMWMLLIQPPLKKIDAWQAETPKLRTQLETLEGVLREVSPPFAGQDLAQALQQTLDAGGLAGHYRLQAPQATPGAWQLSFEEAPADAVIGWLLGNPRQFSLRVTEARLQRAGEAKADDGAGTLSGTVRMDQAQGAKEAS